ncbi:MAG: LytTR family DNA-binding domain-containing protein [Butyrivibrio sp.]|nr:LytTR family DNA-binding domain-containing protein [Butyrivibrio sp.]
MKIAVCDDEGLFVKKIYKYLWDQQDCSVECFTSPLELLEKYRAGERYDVLFLDIIMEPLNGIELAKKIREQDRRTVIVFLTVALEYAPSGYEVDAFRYLLKPVTEKSILDTMREIREKFYVSRTLRVRTPECEMLIHTEELHYLEADNKECVLHYMGDSIAVRKSLSDIEKQLPTRLFFRIHRKYIVNFSRVREFDDKKLTLDCGKTLPLSRRRSAEFCNALNRYIEGNFDK